MGNVICQKIILKKGQVWKRTRKARKFNGKNTLKTGENHVKITWEIGKDHGKIP